MRAGRTGVFVRAVGHLAVGVKLARDLGLVLGCGAVTRHRGQQQANACGQSCTLDWCRSGRTCTARCGPVNAHTKVPSGKRRMQVTAFLAELAFREAARSSRRCTAAIGILATLGLGGKQL